MLEQQQQPVQQEECRLRQAAISDPLAKLLKSSETSTAAAKKGYTVVDDHKNDRLFIKSFLIDSSQNVNNWGVSAESIKYNIASFIGKPVVVYYDPEKGLDHPTAENRELVWQFVMRQDNYRVGSIIDVVQDPEKPSHYYAISEITDKQTKELLRTASQQNTLQDRLFVSPGIHEAALPMYASSRGNHNPAQLNDWIGLHLALVTRPAYGRDKAVISKTCSGVDEKQCLLQLKSAAAILDYQRQKLALATESPESAAERRGFCVTKVLSAAIDLDNNSSSNHNKENENNLIVDNQVSPAAIAKEGSSSVFQKVSVYHIMSTDNVANNKDQEGEKVPNPDPTKNPEERVPAGGGSSGGEGGQQDSSSSQSEQSEPSSGNGGGEQDQAVDEEEQQQAAAKTNRASKVSQSSTVVENETVKSDYASLKAELRQVRADRDRLQHDNNALRANSQAISTRLAAIENEFRTAKQAERKKEITQIVQQSGLYNSQDPAAIAVMQNHIDLLQASTQSLDEIRKVLVPLVENNQKAALEQRRRGLGTSYILPNEPNNTSSFTSRVPLGTSTITPRTASKKEAAVSTGGETPSFLKLRDQLFNGGGVA